MPGSRYAGRTTVVLKSKEYKDQLDKRGVVAIKMYAPRSIRFPTPKEIAQLTLVPHVWKDGDRFFNLASEHYISENDWWVIALFNKKPTEASVKIGEVIHIPKPLEKILDFMQN